MTVALPMSVVLIVAFGAEVDWLCRCDGRPARPR